MNAAIAGSVTTDQTFHVGRGTRVKVRGDPAGRGKVAFAQAAGQGHFARGQSRPDADGDQSSNNEARRMNFFTAPVTSIRIR